MDSSNFNKKYFQTRNYVDYLNRVDRYHQMAREISDLLNKIGLLDRNSHIVDFGCALGFLIEGFKEAGHQNIKGYDISEWAKKEGRKRGNVIANSYDNLRADVMIALDVFEHLKNTQIMDAVVKIRPQVMVVRIPNSTDGGKTFHLEISKNDPTHINCKTKEEWIHFFNDLGYHSLKLNAHSIYDSEGVTCLLLLKKG